MPGVWLKLVPSIFSKRAPPFGGGVYLALWCGTPQTLDKCKVLFFFIRFVLSLYREAATVKRGCLHVCVCSAIQAFFVFFFRAVTLASCRSAFQLQLCRALKGASGSELDKEKGDRWIASYPFGSGNIHIF